MTRRCRCLQVGLNRSYHLGRRALRVPWWPCVQHLAPAMREVELDVQLSVTLLQTVMERPTIIVTGMHPACNPHTMHYGWQTLQGSVPTTQSFSLQHHLVEGCMQRAFWRCTPCPK